MQGTFSVCIVSASDYLGVATGLDTDKEKKNAAPCLKETCHGGGNPRGPPAMD